MKANDSGGVLAGLCFWAVIGGIGYTAYNHFYGLEVHSKTIVAAKVKDVGFEREYDENWHLERNKISAAFNVPIGPVSVKRRWSVEEETSIRTSTTVSTNSEPARYSRVYDQSGALTGQGLNTDLFGYNREYCKSGKLKSEALSAGLNVTIGPVELQCRRIWTFTKPAPKNYPLSFDNWGTRSSSHGSLNKDFPATDLQKLLKALDTRPISHLVPPKENEQSQIPDNHLTYHLLLNSAELQALRTQWNKKNTPKFVHQP